MRCAQKEVCVCVRLRVRVFVCASGCKHGGIDGSMYVHVYVPHKLPDASLFMRVLTFLYSFPEGTKRDRSPVFQ